MRSARLAALLVAATPLSAFAYIDPNAGGWLFQLLFPLLVAIGGAWRLMRHRAADVVRRWLRRGTEAGSTNSNAIEKMRD